VSDVPATLTAWRKVCAEISQLTPSERPAEHAAALQRVRELAPQVDPEYRAVEALFQSGSADALRIYHDAMGPGPLNARAGRTRSPLIIGAIKNGFSDFLHAWLDLQLSIDGCDNIFITECLDQDSPEILSVFLKTRPCSLPGWRNLRSLAYDPGPRMAVAVSDVFMRSFTPEFLTAGRLSGAASLGWKFYCVLIRHAVDMKPRGIDMSHSEKMSASARDLLSKLGSKHGQLDLLSREPDRVAMLRRAPNEPFFSIEA